jgi:DNA polymerase III subunit delta'
VSFERLAPEQHDTLDGIPEPSETLRLFGHEDAATTLADAHKAGRMPQGLILAGARGIGKATLAFHLARHLLRFPQPQSAPPRLEPAEPASPVFRQVASGAHPSVLHLTRPLNEKTKTFRTVISVDEIRRIGRFLSHTAPGGGFRVVIVDPADDLNIPAANALLKNLEEPPQRTVFLLVTHSLGRLLPTLRSRCQVMRLLPLDTDDLLQALGGLTDAMPPGADGRAELHRRSGGSVRQALLLLEHGGLDITAAVEGFASSARFDPVEAHRLADAVAGKGRDAAFDILNARALEMLGDAASQAAERGDLARGEQLSHAWEVLRRSNDEAAAFNLDRKQQALETLGRLHRALRSPA